MVIALFVCCGNGTKSNKKTEEPKAIAIIPFEYHETYKLSEHASDSPTLKFDFSLSLIETGDSTATSNMNQAIAYTLFENASRSIEKACDNFIAQRKKEYKELLQLISRNEDKLLATMTEEQKELFTKYADCVREYQVMAECLLFQNSFRLGGRIMLEVMRGGTGNE